MKFVGYRFNTGKGLEGEAGAMYDYILAANGVFVQCAGPLLDARICLAEAQIRGLLPLEKRLYLPKGNIPHRLYDLALNTFYTDPYKEFYLAVTWDEEYHIRMPPQKREKDEVVYEKLPNTVLDIHSHGSMRAFFSSEIDNPDEQGFKLYLVVGKMNTLQPEVLARVGIYGNWWEISPEEIFV